MSGSLNFNPVIVARPIGRKTSRLHGSCHFKFSERRADSNRYRIQAASETVTDDRVPEGHKGLHGFLYGEGGAEAHDDDLPDQDIEAAAAHAGRTAVGEYLSARLGLKKAGVYAVIDKAGLYQYVGYARSIHDALKVHQTAVAQDRCCFVEARPLPQQAVANRARLQAEADAWLAELATPPPGNAEERQLWQAKVVADVETFEEKKLKLQKAMGENLNDIAEDATGEQRRQNLLSAVSQDDWSSVIDAQTQETVQQPEVLARQGSDVGAASPASPFSMGRVQQEIGREQEAQAMTLENVDRALEEVRPFLIADGGNVEVVDVSDGTVALRLQGACGTCASSSATMKMGIERALKGAFGEALKEVKQVDAKDTSSSVFSVNSHLDMLRPAIKSYGGSVEVKEVAQGRCTVQYKGPPTIGGGIVAAIKSQFPDITDVVMTE